jgi:hypothetical protein
MVVCLIGQQHLPATVCLAPFDTFYFSPLFFNRFVLLKAEAVPFGTAMKKGLSWMGCMLKYEYSIGKVGRDKLLPSCLFKTLRFKTVSLSACLNKAGMGF